jgi:hypothetical protein
MYFVVASGRTVVCAAAVLRCGKQIEKLPHYYFSWIVSFQKQRYICKLLRFETKQSGCKILYHLDLRGRGDVSRGNIQQQALQQEGLQRKEEGTTQVQDSNVESNNLESRRKLENLKKEMQKNEVSVLGVSEV